MTQGPSRAPVVPRDIAPDSPDLIVALIDAIADRLPDTDLLQAMRIAIEGPPISWTCCTATIQVFEEHFDQETADALQIDRDEVLSHCRQLRDPVSWPFLWDDDSDWASPPDPACHYETWCCNLIDSSTPWIPKVAVPRPRAVGRARIILHAFAGRRRLGDYQWARSVELPRDPPADGADHRRLPHPVRSAESLWGLVSLALRELSQVCDGNDLLGFCLEAMAELACLHMTGILEHPAEPDQVDFPSIWKLILVQLLLLQPGAQRIKFAQGLLGVDSAKPTEFFALNLPDLSAALVQWRVNA
eukprot:s2290_g2.t1